MNKHGLIGHKKDWLARVLTKFPLTYNGILVRQVGKDFSTIVDIGCGTGMPMELIKELNPSITATGIDIYQPYLDECAKRNSYEKLIRADIRTYKFKKKSYDVIMCLHVLEHLEKKDGFAFIKQLEKVAKKRVVFALPIGHLHQEEYDDNEHQIHKSEWYPQDFRNLGYTVIGQGLRILYGQDNVVKKYGRFSYILFFISMLFQIMLFLKPEAAIYMFCKKELHQKV